MEYLSFNENVNLSTIEQGAFELPPGARLRHLHIRKSPKLTNLPPGALMNFDKLETLQVVNCGLKNPPDWSFFNPGINQRMTRIDLSGNNIQVLSKKSFAIWTFVEKLILDYNRLEKIENYAFEESSIQHIQIKNNPTLTELEEHAFTGGKDLLILDLSNSSIETLPTSGLGQVQRLVLNNVPSLRKFPSVLKLTTVEEANLTYAHHCCAFSHPEKQNERLWQIFQQEIRANCSTTISDYERVLSTTPLTTFWYPGEDFTRGRTVPRWLKQSLLSFHRENRRRRFVDARTKQSLGDHSKWFRLNDNGFYVGSSNFESWGGHSSSDFNGTVHQVDNSGVVSKQKEVWHTSTLNPNETYTQVITCGEGVVGRIKLTRCSPTPDAFNPCEDIMGFVWLRVVVWFVVTTALFGNMIVLIVTIGSKYKITVSKFLMCNLAFSDLILSFYLLVVAAFDLRSIGLYFNMAIWWQQEGGCQIAGFLAIFSTCLSIFTLTVITLERWYAISHAINLTKRLRLRQATVIMLCGWVFALLFAALPLFGISDYGKTSICLPMDASEALDKAYLFTLLIVNVIAFLIISICYVDMFRQVRGNDTAAGRNDANIAKRMAVLVFTDFACLFPIAFFGMTAAAGNPLITVTDSKILLVFFFPLNSCCNPFLYAIFTKQFCKDYYGMMSRCGFFEKKAARYRLTSNPASLSHSRNSIPNNHTIHRISAGSSTGTYLSDTRGSRSSIGTNSPKNGTPQTTPKDLRKSILKEGYSKKLTANGIPPVLTGQTRAEVTQASKNTRDNRKLSVVRESSHGSTSSDSMSQQPPAKPTKQTEKKFDFKTIRSVSQYADTIDRAGIYDSDQKGKSAGRKDSNFSNTTETSFTDTSLFSDSTVATESSMLPLQDTIEEEDHVDSFSEDEQDLSGGELFDSDDTLLDNKVKAKCIDDQYDGDDEINESESLFHVKSVSSSDGDTSILNSPSWRDRGRDRPDKIKVTQKTESPRVVRVTEGLINTSFSPSSSPE